MPLKAEFVTVLHRGIIINVLCCGCFLLSFMATTGLKGPRSLLSYPIIVRLNYIGYTSVKDEEEEKTTLVAS